MSDDLTERLRDRRVCSPAQNSCRNDYICDLAAARIEELEAKLAVAVEALGTALSEMVDYADTHPAWSEIWEAREAARTTLAELSSVSCANTTGGKDE